MIGRVAIALVLAAEALAFYVLGELIMRIYPEAQNELVSAPAFVAIGFIAFFAPAALDWFAVERGRRALTIGVLGLVAIYAALRLQYAHDLALWDFGWASDFVLETGSIRDWILPVLTSGVLLLVTWLRAAWRARSSVWLEAVPRSLAISFALVTLALLLSAASEQSEIVTRSGVIFYGVALAALASSQLGQTGATIGGLRSSGVTTALLAGTGAFTVLGVLLIGVLLDPLIDALSIPFFAVLDAVIWFLTWAVFFPLIWVLTVFFEFIFSLLGGNSEPQQIQLPAPPPGGEGGEGAGEDEGPSLASRIARYALTGGALFLGVAIVAAAVFIIAILRRRALDAADEGSDSESAGSLGEDLRGAARSLFRRERRHDPSGEGAVRLYLEVLESARKAGKPRSGAQTPHEFAPVLADAFDPAVTDEITAAFEHARYADRPPDEAALTALRRRWEGSS